MRLPALPTLAAAAVGALVLATPALGDVVVKNRDLTDIPSRPVLYSDLDLDSSAGVDTLNRRLVSAVHAVCPNVNMRLLREYAEMRNCREDSLVRAFADRDELLATRMAARGNPDQLALLDAKTLRVTR